MLSTKLGCILTGTPLRMREILNLGSINSKSKFALCDNSGSVMKCSTKPVKESNPVKADVKPKEKNKKSNQGAAEILQYMQSENLQNDIEKIPQKLFKKLRTLPKELYLVNRSVAKEVVGMLMQDLSKKDLYVVEGNPGPGLITEELLAAGIPAIQLFQPETHFQHVLKALQEQYPQRLTIQNANLFYIWKLLYQDKFDNGDRLETLLASAPTKDWEEEPCMQVVGVLPNPAFLSHMIISAIFRSSIMAWGRPALYLIMEPSAWHHLTCDRTAGYILYRSTTVLFQLMFDYKVIGKVPRQAFLPWQSKYVIGAKSKLTKVKQIDPDLMYVTRIEPKANLCTDIVSREHLVPLWYFVRHHMNSRRARIIPHLERWIPGCGPRLIAKDFNIFSEFGQLSPQEFLELYKDFSSWPGFNESLFLSSMETVLLKMENTSEDLEDIEGKVQSEIDGEDHVETEEDLHEEFGDGFHEEIEDDFHGEAEDEDHADIHYDPHMEFEKALGKTKSRR